MTGFLRLSDKIAVCVAATVNDLQVLKLQISDSMSNHLALAVQHLKEISNNQQSFIIKALAARKSSCSKDSTCD